MNTLKFHLNVAATRIRTTWISLCDAPRRWRYRRGFVDAMTLRYLHAEPLTTIQELRQSEPQYGPCNPYNAGLDQALGLIKKLNHATQRVSHTDTRQSRLHEHLHRAAPATRTTLF